MLTRSAPTGGPAVPHPVCGTVPRLSVLIPVLNDAAGLRRCLASVRADPYPADRLEIIVADNGSTDGSGEVAAGAGAVVVRMTGLSVAAVRNRLAALATGDILVFVDADHEISPGWMLAAVETLAGPRIGAAGAPYHPPASATWVQRLYDTFREHSAGITEARWLGSGNLAVKRTAFVAAGGFDTSLTACEDVDFCARLRREGYRLVADSRLRSVHHGDPRTLRQLFVSELWRGRDNLRVSFRGPLTWRDLPGVLTPVAVLMTLLILLPSMAVRPAGGWMLLAPAMLVAGAAPVARTSVMLRRLGRTGLLDAPRAFAVALTYDLARALALVVRKGHRRAR
jgi:glycosyltransferase involved in cell wall biosynthesis